MHACDHVLLDNALRDMPAAPIHSIWYDDGTVCVTGLG